MSFRPSLQERVRKHLDELEESGLRRRLQSPSGIDLSSNDYLGLAAHPLIKAKMAEAIINEGCGSTGSRLLRGERACFAAIERKFAEFKQAEGALYFGSGYAANIGVLTAFLERMDVVFSDELNHASLIDGIRLSHARRIKFPHRQVDRVAQLLRDAPATAQKFLVTESVFSMDGDFAPLAEYAQLCRETNTALIVDEAHAVGIFVPRGSGLVEDADVDDAVFLTVNPAGKALGAAGAFVAGPLWAVDFLIQSARSFIFSTAPPPAIAAALDASLDLIQQEPDRRRRLLDRAALLRSLLSEAGMNVGHSTSQIIPILLGENERACAMAAELQREGFDVRAIRPPSVPPGTARLRVSVNAALDETTLRRFASTASRIWTTLPSCSTVSS